LHAAEAKEALHDLALTREERDRMAQQVEVLQAAQAAAAAESGKQAMVSFTVSHCFADACAQCLYS